MRETGYYSMFIEKIIFYVRKVMYIFKYIHTVVESETDKRKNIFKTTRLSFSTLNAPSELLRLRLFSVLISRLNII